MAIIERNVGTPAAMRNFFNDNCVPYYFSSVTLSDNAILFYEGDNLIFKIQATYVDSDYILSKIEAWKSVSNSVSRTYSTTQKSYFPGTSIALCDGGIIVRFGVREYNSPLLITKSNSGKTVFVFSSDSANSASNAKAKYTNIASVAWGDSITDVSSERILTFNAVEEYQTQFVPFTTYCQPDTVSYTPAAYYMPIGQYFSLSYGKFISGNYTYITNGYWAVKDASIEFDNEG